MARTVAALVILLLGFAGAARAQTSPHEAPAIGVAGSIGWLGNVGAVRVSAPMTSKASFDLTAGHVVGRADADHSGARGASLAAQIRWLWRGRRADGFSGHWIFGVMGQQGIDRTEIRFPGRTVVQRTSVTNITPQVGYGWDRLLSTGTRFGLEISTGGNERGPSQYLQAFVVWGRPRR